MQYTSLWLPVHDQTLSSGFGAIELGEDASEVKWHD